MDKKLGESDMVEVVNQVHMLSADRGLYGSAGEAEIWDFSTANRNEQSRIDAVQKVASICFQSDAKIGTSALYDKLMAESLGLPSSSFEFIPVLLRDEDVELINGSYVKNFLKEEEAFLQTPRIEKYGVTVIDGNSVYKLTNLRALLYDTCLINTFCKSGDEIDVKRNFFNTDPREIRLIQENFFVFNTKIDIVTARQFMRHRTSWQELSRRYVSGKKVPFEVYLTFDMQNADINVGIYDALGREKPLLEDGCDEIKIDALDLVILTLRMYDAAVSTGVRPQDARRIIPQGALTQVWSAWFKPQFDDMVELRSDGKAQWEVRTLAKSLSGLVSRTI